MLTISVNGREQKLNIGCKTFITLDEMLKLLEAKKLHVTLNGKAVRSHEFSATTIKSGDILILN